MGSEEAKSRLEERIRDKTVLLEKRQSDDSVCSGDFSYYGYNEYGSVEECRELMMGPNGKMQKQSFSNDVDIDKLEEKAASIDANEATDYAEYPKHTYDEQGRCTHMEKWDGTELEYLYNKKGQLECVTNGKEGEIAAWHIKYSYNSNGTLAMRICDDVQEKTMGPAKFTQFYSRVTQYHYTTLSEAQYDEALWPTYDDVYHSLGNTAEDLSNLAIFPGTTPPQTVLPYDKRPGWITTAEHGLVLRAAPNTNAKKLATIPLDSEILQFGKTSGVTGWVFTWYQREYGWVSAQYLKGGEIYRPNW